MRWSTRVLVTSALSCLAVLPTASVDAQRRPSVDGYRIVKVYPHDPDAYTQGLIIRDGVLYESTGRNGQSTLRKVDLETGRVLQQHRLDAQYFAEGLTELNGQLVQLTWQSSVAFAYDFRTFALRRTFNYAGEGWGLTTDGKRFILSDGCARLRYMDPATFREVRSITVMDGRLPVRNLNELEFVNGQIYANVWHTDRLARVSPSNGQVLGWIDLGGLMAGYRLDDPEAVLNGIAHDAATNRLFVTGKLWPRLFEVEIVPGR